MSVVYDEGLDPYDHKGPPHCLFCGRKVDYPRIEWSASFYICADCAKHQMPGLWSDALELNAVMEIRRIGNRADTMLKRTSVESEKRAFEHIKAKLIDGLKS